VAKNRFFNRGAKLKIEMLILKSWQKVKISRRGLVIPFFVGMTAAKTESFQSCPLPFAIFPLIGGIKASTGLAAVGVIFAPPCQLSSSCTRSLLYFSTFLMFTRSQQLRTTEYLVQLLYYTCLAPTLEGYSDGTKDLGSLLWLAPAASSTHR
jgi:hypothetical protein